MPQNLAALASLMGGDAAAASKLETFVSSLNATRNSPYEWSGNEPDEWAPWEFDYFGAPEKTQQSVRAIVNTEYADAPVDEPGNDDLGALSSWYVWAALGLFPVTPGSANLALASPLFPSVTITLPDGHRLVEQAPAAAASRPFVHALTVSGVAHPSPRAPGCPDSPAPRSPTGAWTMPWLPASVLQTGGTLRFALSSSPDPTWATSPTASPPSFTAGELPVVGFSLPSGATTIAVGQPTPISIGAALAGARATVGPLEGHVELERPGSLPVLGNDHSGAGDGGPRHHGRLRPATSFHPTPDRDRSQRRFVFRARRPCHHRRDDAAAGRARRRGALTVGADRTAKEHCTTRATRATGSQHSTQQQLRERPYVPSSNRSALSSLFIPPGGADRSRL